MLSAVIVGAGFSGLCAGIQLKQRRHHRLRDPREGRPRRRHLAREHYPGAACDVPSHLYSYSFEPNPTWSRAYGGRPRSSRTSSTAPTSTGCAPHLRFGQQVDERALRRGDRHVEHHDRGRRALRRARADARQRRAAHPVAARDPGPRRRSRARRSTRRAGTTTTTCTGKRVAVIGTGASAIQFVPQIAPKVAQLARLSSARRRGSCPSATARSPSAERWLFEHVPGAHWLRRTGLYWLMESRVVGFAYAPKVNELAREARAALPRAAGAGSGAAREADAEVPVRLQARADLERLLPGAAARRTSSSSPTRSRAITPRGVRTADGGEREVDAIDPRHRVPRHRVSVVDRDRRPRRRRAQRRLAARRCATTSASRSRASRTCSC